MVGCARALIGLRVLLYWAEGEAQGTFCAAGLTPIAIRPRVRPVYSERTNPLPTSLMGSAPGFGTNLFIHPPSQLATYTLPSWSTSIWCGRPRPPGKRVTGDANQSLKEPHL